MMRIGIIGCGLIGGSMAALFKKYMADVYITGIDPHTAAFKATVAGAAFDDYVASIADVPTPPDLLVIASPIDTVLGVIDQATKKWPSSLRIMELSSVKSFLKHPIVATSHHTIGFAHPMGGRDVSGLAHADASVLDGCPMIVCSSDAWLHDLCEQCGFSIIPCPSLEVHDEWMAAASHGPYIAASVLPHALRHIPESTASALGRVIAGGFRDTTRVCNSPTAWGRDVITHNAVPLRPLIDAMIDSLQQLKTAMDHRPADLQQWVMDAKATRSRLMDAAASQERVV
jgi:prephenate dehydrogenase